MKIGRCAVTAASVFFLCLAAHGATIGALPGRFGFGLSNAPWDVATLTAMCPYFDYRYQYFSGDCRGTNWKDWNSPEGVSALWYMEESEGAGVIPVLTYYMMAHSTPNPGNEDYTPKIVDATTMNAYYENWKLLMQKCGEFGGTVIVHHEPDLWGYIQQNVGVVPTDCAASVASSGFAEAAGLADDATGFAKLLVRVRDTYAPNVILGWHVSAWATGYDIITNLVDPVEKGNEVAQFYIALGASFDMLFADPSDRDSGYKQIVLGNGNAWWTNDSFVRFRHYLGAIGAATGLKTMLWQVPCGNTLYLTCDNTWNHYQDNRPEYFLLPQNRDHIVEYAAAGVIGCLFGPGTDGCTTAYDSAGDGVTNPAAINGNTLVATHADDDGGFMRSSANTYYTTGTVSWRLSSGGDDCGAATGRPLLAPLVVLVVVLAGRLRVRALSRAAHRSSVSSPHTSSSRA